MSQITLPGDPPIPVVLRRSARARRISLRVSQLDGRVTLTLPRRVSEREALSFAREKQSWIRRHLEARGEDVQIGPGSVIPIAGEPHEIRSGSGRRVVFTEGQVRVPGDPERIGRRLAGHLRELARVRLAEASDFYAERLGRPYSAITLRDTRSRWGSCTSEGRLMYSWRLIMAPPGVLEYVAAHEVAHLAQMNHSAAFWAGVERIYGEYDAPRRWLRTSGGELHRYRFTDKGRTS
ncbi:SprT family zinc-dependent metalloprotease [uncultured Roseobacter sp.]|uniref:M48 family metallopeptidase n=1 Tax=uncultured Roseobacter sp. TaxID=114847 RepID=UPI0026266A2C|nr:SprT family zinc-dependent metalloprotease [uncultured Roseobacter sp.]